MTSLDSTSSSSSSSTAAAYDQWQEWAKHQRRTQRKEAEDLIYGDDDDDKDDEDETDSQVQIQKHMELPHKKSRGSLLDDEEDDDSESNDQPWKMLPRLLQARKSLLEDDSDDEDDFPSLAYNCNYNNYNTCDALFLPPTSLRRSEERGPPRIPSNRSLALSSLSTHSNTSLKQSSLSFDSSSSKSSLLDFDVARSPVAAVPLVCIAAAMTSRRRFTVSRQGSLPIARL